MLQIRAIIHKKPVIENELKLKQMLFYISDVIASSRGNYETHFLITKNKITN